MYRYGSTAFGMQDYDPPCGPTDNCCWEAMSIISPGLPPPLLPSQILTGELSPASLNCCFGALAPATIPDIPAVRGFLRCIQRALRARGYAVAIDGRWDRQTRTSLYRHLQRGSAVAPPAVGSSIRWVSDALLSLTDDLISCYGDAETVATIGEQFAWFVSSIEASGKLEGESQGLPWTWFGVGSVVGCTVVGLAWLAFWYRRGR